MATPYEKQIEQLKNQIADIEAKKEKEEREKAVLEKVYEDLTGALHAADMSIDAFLRFTYRDVKRVVARVEKEKAKEEQTEVKAPIKKAAPPPPRRGANAARRKRRYRSRSQPVNTTTFRPILTQCTR